MNKYIFVGFFSLISFAVVAQKYNTLAGIRIGDDFGISFAQRVAKKTTVELNHQPGTFAGKELTTIFAKQHYPLLTKRVNFFMGAGLYSRSAVEQTAEYERAVRSNGLAMTFGAEISLGRLSISTDYQPLVTFNKNDSNQRFYTTSGLSLRYILVPRASSTKKFFRMLFGKD
ncbi:MAG TPA: hypothetical protein PKD51_17655 [Saprospiraceae bacterium]|nr:hypothetical protein [Saprospiraceae bacterium]